MLNTGKLALQVPLGEQTVPRGKFVLYGWNSRSTNPGFR